MTFDLTEFLTGEAATKAAIEDGVIEEGDPVPDDYYIRNRNPLLRTMPLAEEVKLLIIDWEADLELFRGQLAPLADAFERNHANAGNYRNTSPYWLRVQDGRILKIQKQYLP